MIRLVRLNEVQYVEMEEAATALKERGFVETPLPTPGEKSRSRKAVKADDQ